jgi:hypothetical protein
MRLILALFALSLTFTAPAWARFVTIDDVRDLAFGKGIVTIEEVELDDGIWKVEGYDSAGAEIKMKVDAANGQIIKLKRDDD